MSGVSASRLTSHAAGPAGRTVRGSLTSSAEGDSVALSAKTAALVSGDGGPAPAPPLGSVSDHPRPWADLECRLGKGERERAAQRRRQSHLTVTSGDVVRVTGVKCVELPALMLSVDRGDIVVLQEVRDRNVLNKPDRQESVNREPLYGDNYPPFPIRPQLPVAQRSLPVAARSKAECRSYWSHAAHTTNIAQSLDACTGRHRAQLNLGHAGTTSRRPAAVQAYRANRTPADSLVGHTGTTGGKVS